MKLKRRMTYEEMARYLSETTGKVVNRVSVGRYAKKLGYRVYKPMINRKSSIVISTMPSRTKRRNHRLRKEETMGKSRNRRNGASQGAPFLKCYSRMLGVFDPEEIVFMLYMADLSRLRGKGFDTLRSKRTHMANTGIGSRLFDRCVRRMTALGLLERVPLKGMYDYLWDRQAYERLIEILNAPTSALDARAVGRHLFVTMERNILSISNKEIEELGKRV